MKKLLVTLTLLALTLTSILQYSVVTGLSDVITINDNEQGWVNTEIRFNAPDVLNNSVSIASGETAAYDADGDNFSLAWNYSMFAAVNSGSYDFLVKNLEEPVIGGIFEFNFWVRNAGGVDPNGLKIEAVAFEADGTAHNLGVSEAVMPKTGTPQNSTDTNWYVYSKNMPENKAIVKMEIRLYNGAANATVWGTVNLDKITFKDTIIGDYTRISENGWIPVTRTSETPSVANGDMAYSHEGDSVIVLSGGVTPDLEYLKTISMEKTLETPVTEGYFEYKVYMDAFISSTSTASHTKTKAAAYDAQGTVYDLGTSESIIRYGAWIGGGNIYGGWNQFRAKLPAGVDITKIQISIFWVENGGMGALPYFVDDIKVVKEFIPEPTVTPTEEAAPTEEPVPTEIPDPTPTDVPEPTPTDVPAPTEVPAEPTPTAVPTSAPTPTAPADNGEYFQSTPFVPDDFTANTNLRTNINDNELNWYTDEVLMNGDVMLDGSRIFDNDPETTNAWQKVENNYVRTDTDDAYSAAFMFKVGHPIVDRKYDIIYKDLQAPVKGGKFSFYVWFRNGLPQNHNVFAVDAVAYDAAGNAYSLGLSDLLGWSGDERYFTNPEDPNVAIMKGWQYYEGILPKDVEIVKMGIALVKTDDSSTAAEGPTYNGTWYGEDWTVVDQIAFEDTVVCDDNIIMDDESKWVSDQAVLTELNEYLYPWIMIDGKTIEIDTSFNSNGNENTVMVYRNLEKGLKGGKFSFKLFNPTNSNVSTEAKFKVSVIGYTRDGQEISLGDATPGDYGNEYLKFSGLPEIAYNYNGYSNMTVALPTDTVIAKLGFVITETTNATLSSALFYLDDVKYIGSEQTALTGDDTTPTSTPSENNPQTGDYGVFGTVLVIMVLTGAFLVWKRKAVRSI